MFERGEVWRAELPDIGQKFVVVVSALRVATALRPIVVRVTSVRRPRAIPTVVPLSEDRVEGLDDRSLAVCHDIFTIPGECLVTRCGRISDETLALVDRALRVALGMTP